MQECRNRLSGYDALVSSEQQNAIHPSLTAPTPPASKTYTWRARTLARRTGYYKYRRRGCTHALGARELNQHPKAKYPAETGRKQ